MTVKYEIRPGSNAPCELVSIVPIPIQILPNGMKWGGGRAVNFVADGTHTECKRILDELERKK